MMRIYEYLWENETTRTFILGGSFAFLALLLDIILLIWDNDLRELELLSFIYTQIPFLDSSIEPILCLIHIVLWIIFFFFFFIVYANIRDLINSPSSYIDMAIIIVVVALAAFVLSGASGTLNGPIVGLGVFLLSLVVSFYIQAAIREIES
ncbi:MAG: hypothetical protein ACFFC7_04020 [Candidatus Hermodarchaeota archaeon]